MTGIMPGALVTFSSSAFTTTRAAVQSNVMAGGTSTLGGGEANAPLLSYRNVNVASAVEAGPSNASILSENDEVDSNQTLQQGKKWCEYQYWSANGNGRSCRRAGTRRNCSPRRPRGGARRTGQRKAVECVPLGGRP